MKIVLVFSAHCATLIISYHSHTMDWKRLENGNGSHGLGVWDWDWDWNWDWDCSGLGGSSQQDCRKEGESSTWPRLMCLRGTGVLSCYGTGFERLFGCLVEQYIGGRICPRANSPFRELAISAFQHPLFPLFPIPRSPFLLNRKQENSNTHHR